MQKFTDIVDHVRENSPDPSVCMISFSGGKDAWGVWAALKDHFEVKPFFYYLVPGLEVVEEYLAYCEQKIGSKIVQLPSPKLFEMLNDRVFQPWERLPTVFAANFPSAKEYDWDAIQKMACRCFDLPTGTWTARGIRAADSIARSSAILKHGAWNDRKKAFDPIWDWKKPDILTALKKHDIKLSKEYLAFGRTFDGLYLLYAYGLKKYFPNDYKKCLEFFPYFETEMFRLEKALGKYGNITSLPRDEALENMCAPVDAPEKVNTPAFDFDFVFDFGAPPPAAEKKGKKKESAYSKLNAENKKMANKMKTMTDAGFLCSIDFTDHSRFVIVFEDKRQADYFIEAMDFQDHGWQYLDGGYVADKMGLAVPGVEYDFFADNLPDAPNPFRKLKYTGNPETDSRVELQAFLNACPKPSTGNSSLAHKFLAAANWEDIAHVTENGLTCIWCHDLSIKLGIKLPPTIYFYRPKAKPDAKLNAFVA